MSWRTRRESPYRGLSPRDHEWLRDFDKRWDTKAEGRSQDDAMDFLESAPETAALPVEDSPPEFARFMAQIERVSIARQYKTYCAVQTFMRDQTVKTLRFRSLRAANQNRRMLLDFIALATDPVELQQLVEDPELSRHPTRGPRDED